MPPMSAREGERQQQQQQQSELSWPKNHVERMLLNWFQKRERTERRGDGQGEPNVLAAAVVTFNCDDGGGGSNSQYIEPRRKNVRSFACLPACLPAWPIGHRSSRSGLFFFFSAVCVCWCCTLSAALNISIWNGSQGERAQQQ